MPQNSSQRLPVHLSNERNLHSGCGEATAGWSRFMSRMHEVTPDISPLHTLQLKDRTCLVLRRFITALATLT